MPDRSELALQLTDAVIAAQQAIERAGNRAYKSFGLSQRAHAVMAAVDLGGPDGARPSDIASELGDSRASGAQTAARTEVPRGRALSLYTDVRIFMQPPAASHRFAVTSGSASTASFIRMRFNALLRQFIAALSFLASARRPVSSWVLFHISNPARNCG